MWFCHIHNRSKKVAAYHQLQEDSNCLLPKKFHSPSGCYVLDRSARHYWLHFHCTRFWYVQSPPTFQTTITEVSETSISKGFVIAAGTRRLNLEGNIDAINVNGILEFFRKTTENRRHQPGNLILPHRLSLRQLSPLDWLLNPLYWRPYIMYAQPVPVYQQAPLVCWVPWRVYRI